MTLRVYMAAVVTVMCFACPDAAVAQGPVPSPSALPGPSATAVSRPSASATPRAERRDLLLDLPTQFGGMDAQADVIRGEEHLANLDLGDPAARETADELMALLAETGAAVEDLSSGYALVSLDDLFAFAFAVRVEGAEAGRLLAAYLPILLGDLVEPSTAEARVGGKDVLVVTSMGDDGEPVDLYVYDAGDTIWMVQGPDDVVEHTLANLP